jgi:hypothetical protein
MLGMIPAGETTSMTAYYTPLLWNDKIMSSDAADDSFLNQHVINPKCDVRVTT